MQLLKREEQNRNTKIDYLLKRLIELKKQCHYHQDIGFNAVSSQFVEDGQFSAEQTSTYRKGRIRSEINFGKSNE